MTVYPTLATFSTIACCVVEVVSKNVFLPCLAHKRNSPKVFSTGATYARCNVFKQCLLLTSFLRMSITDHRSDLSKQLSSITNDRSHPNVDHRSTLMVILDHFVPPLVQATKFQKHGNLLWYCFQQHFLRVP